MLVTLPSNAALEDAVPVKDSHNLFTLSPAIPHASKGTYANKNRSPTGLLHRPNGQVETIFPPIESRRHGETQLRVH